MTRTFTTCSLLLLMALGAMASSAYGQTDGAAARSTDWNTEQPAVRNADRTAAQPAVRNAERTAGKAHGSMTENRDALVNLFGERRADAAIMATSPVMQAGLNQAAFSAAVSAAANATPGSAARAAANANAAAKAAAPTATLDSIVDTYLDSGGDWLNDYKTVYTYNAQLLATEVNAYDWSFVQNNWYHSSRVVYAYNNQGLATEMLYYDEFDVLESKMEVFYNAQGLVDSVYTYDSFNGSGLVPFMLQYYHYEAGRLQEISMLVYDEDEDEWFGNVVILFEYDGQGRRTSIGMYLVDEEDDESMLYSMSEYTYNAGGRLATATTSMLNFSTFQVEPSDKIEYTYNAAGDLTMSVDYLWVDGAWGEDFMDEYVYHPNLLFSDVANPYQVMAQLYFFVEAFPEFNRMLTEIHGFEYVAGSWVEADRSMFYVSGEATTGTEEIRVANAVLYPNPASNHITLNWSGMQESLSLEVYHITGSLVMRQEVLSGQRLNIEQLRAGLYLYRLIDGAQTVQAGKLMKR